MLYDMQSGKLDIKKLAAWVVALAAILGATSVVGTQITGWAKWWLDVDTLEADVAKCQTDLAELRAEVHPEPHQPDANERLSKALPLISAALGVGRKERRRHDRAITRLSTIHEFGLSREREREIAQSVQDVVRMPIDVDEDGEREDDPLANLSDL